MNFAARTAFGRAAAALSALLTGSVPAALGAETPGAPTWSNSVYLGVMTEDRVDELPSGPEFTDQTLLGYALAYDRPLDDRWSVGFEVQATLHLGDQDYAEVGVPLTIRYRPQRPWFDALEAFAFGLGLSATSKVPDVEVETRGDSRKTLIYWLLETEFETATPDVSIFFRIHHRSDAWGTLKPEGGSNALVVGLRKDF